MLFSKTVLISDTIQEALPLGTRSSPESSSPVLDCFLSTQNYKVIPLFIVKIELTLAVKIDDNIVQLKLIMSIYCILSLLSDDQFI